MTEGWRKQCKLTEFTLDDRCHDVDGQLRHRLQVRPSMQEISASANINTRTTGLVRVQMDVRSTRWVRFMPFWCLLVFGGFLKTKPTDQNKRLNWHWWQNWRRIQQLWQWICWNSIWMKLGSWVVLKSLGHHEPYSSWAHLLIIFRGCLDGLMTMSCVFSLGWWNDEDTRLETDVWTFFLLPTVR